MDYTLEVTVQIESHARQGIWQFELMLFDIPYNFNLSAMTQRNSITGFERPIRRFVVRFVQAAAHL